MVKFTLEEYLFQVIVPALGTTFRILFWTMLFSSIFGFMLAIALAVTGKNGLRENKVLYKILEVSANIIRSFPFVILVVALIPVTRIIVGTSIGEAAAIFPLSISMTAYYGRLIESHLREVDRDLIDAARSYGASDFQIIWHVLLVQATPGIVSVMFFGIVAALNATTQAGLVGAGGIGAIAIRYGYQNFSNEIMYGTVLIIIVIVQIIQLI